MSHADTIRELQLEVDRCQTAVTEAQKIFDRDNPETRQITAVRLAEYYLTVAENEFKKSWDLTRAEAEKEAAEEARQARRAPPDLQAFVLAHGTYDRITPEAWAKFDADMAEWKRKIREGYFEPKIW